MCKLPLQNLIRKIGLNKRNDQEKERITILVVNKTIILQNILSNIRVQFHSTITFNASATDLEIESHILCPKEDAS